MEAARILGVSYNTYKKYTRKYGIFEDLKNPDGIGIKKGYNLKRGKFALEDILAGKYPNYPIWKLKQRLLNNGYMLEKCNNCGFEERRITDHKVPLVLDFIDGDRKNHKYDNLRMLCFNCSFLINGNLTGTLKKNTNTKMFVFTNGCSHTVGHCVSKPYTLIGVIYELHSKRVHTIISIY